jgi:hypothetical protein
MRVREVDLQILLELAPAVSSSTPLTMRSRSAGERRGALEGQEVGADAKGRRTPAFSSTSDASLRTASARISFSSIVASSVVPRWADLSTGRPLRRALLAFFTSGSGAAVAAVRRCRNAPKLPIDLRRDLRVLMEKVLDVLPALADPLAGKGIPSPTLLNDTTIRAKVDQLAFAGDTYPVEDIELSLFERGRHFILHYPDAGPAADDGLVLLDLSTRRMSRRTEA